MLFLASYAAGRIKLQDRFDFRDAQDVVELLALQLEAAARRAFAYGLLHGYRTEQEALHTVRGRIRIEEQLRRRFGLPVPMEVQYDEFTDDVTANRLVKAAAARLARMRTRAPRSRAGLAWIGARLDAVSLVEYPANAVPAVTFDRLNHHYRQVVKLSRLILRQRSFDAARGGVHAAGFLMDMNVIFQEFVTRALRDALQVSERVFRSDDQLRRVTLDEAGKVGLRPDLTWWDGARCTFAGDVKYKKRIRDAHVPNADLYQLLAYVTALDLPGGLLIYAQGEDEAGFGIGSVTRGSCWRSKPSTCPGRRRPCSPGSINWRTGSAPCAPKPSNASNAARRNRLVAGASLRTRNIGGAEGAFVAAALFVRCCLLRVDRARS